MAGASHSSRSGLPGLVIALLVRLTLVEPRAAPPMAHADRRRAAALATTLGFICSQRSLIHILAGATLTTLVGYSAACCGGPPSSCARTGSAPHDMSAFLALVFGLGSGFGIFLGGYLSDCFGRRDVKLMPRVVTLAILLGLPFGAALYLVDDSTLVFLIIGIPAAAGGMYLGPSIAMAQSLVGVRMRTVASALFLFIINLIGMGLGSLDDRRHERRADAAIRPRRAALRAADRHGVQSLGGVSLLARGSRSWKRT